MAERHADDAPRARRRGLIIASGAVGALFVFAAFLIASFPYDDVLSTLLAPYRLKLVYREQRLHLPIGVTFDGVDLVSIASSPSQLLLRSPRIALRPTLGAILSGRTGLGFDAEVYRGTLNATLDQEAGAIGVTFKARALDLGQSQALSQFGATLGGTFSGGGSGRIDGPALVRSAGRATLEGRNVTLEVTHGFPLIHLGAVSGRLLLEHGVLRFTDLEAHGGDVEARADGTLQLADDPAESTVAARVSLTPTPSGRAHFGLLFNMLPHPPSAGPYEVRGPLRSPSIS